MEYYICILSTDKLIRHCDSIDMALKDTVSYFSEMYKNRDLTEKDFCYMNPIDF